MSAVMPPACPLVLAALAAALLLGTDPASAQQQEQPDPAARAELLDLFNDIVPQLPVERVIRFRLRGNSGSGNGAGGDLAIETDLRIGHGARQVRLQGLEGLAEVHVGQRPRGPMGLVPFYDFSYRGPAGLTGGSLQTTVNVMGGQVRIARVHHLDNLHTTIRLGQESRVRRNGRGVQQPPRENRVTLNVRVVTSTNQLVDDLRVTAGSFEELLRKHAGPAAKYLAPLFRDFGQDAEVFAVEARVAWQLFPDAVEADEALASRVLALLDRFNDDDFRVREAAATELDALGGPAVLVLGELDREALPAEQNTRIDAFLAKYRRLDPADLAALLEDPEFLLRCYTYCEEQPARAAAVRALERLLARDDLHLDPASGLPARTRAAALVRDTLPKPE